VKGWFFFLEKKGKMDNVFWSSLANSFIPNGRNVYTVSDIPSGDVMATIVCFDLMSNPRERHWYQSAQADCIRAFQTTTFCRSIGGAWKKYGGTTTQVTALPVTLAHVSKSVTNAKWVVLVMTEEVIVPVVEQQRFPFVPVFAYHLKGRLPLVAKRPQEMATAWRAKCGGVIAAFDFRPDFLGRRANSLQAFAVFPALQIREIRFSPEDLKCFYETIEPTVPVGLFIGFDALLSEFPGLGRLTLVQIIDKVFHCVKKTWDEFYPGRTPCPVNVTNVHVFNWSVPNVNVSLQFVASTRLSTVFWRNASHFRPFLAAVRKHAFRELLDRDVDNTAPPRKLIDLTVCDTYHKFPMFVGQNRPANFIEEVVDDFSDSLVCKRNLPEEIVLLIHEEVVDKEKHVKLMGQIVLSLFPDDTFVGSDCWIGELFFGMPGTNYHYTWRGPFSLVRRDEKTDTLSIARVDKVEWEQWALFERQRGYPHCSDHMRARTLLEMVDKWVKETQPVDAVIPIGILDLGHDLRICYYAKRGIKAPPVLTVSIRMGTCKTNKLPDQIRRACFMFAVDCLSYPPPPSKPDPQERIQSWIFCGIPKANIFYLTDPADVDMRIPDGFPELRPGMKIILDGKMGSGKTVLVDGIQKEMADFLYVSALRSLSKNGARRFDIDSHLDENDQVRDNLDACVRLSIVINSLWRLCSDRNNIFWDEFRQIILAFLSENMLERGNVLTVWKVMCQMIQKMNGGVQFFADANISPELEGWFLNTLLGGDMSNVFVIIKDTERNPWDKVDCYELLGDEADFWKTVMHKVADNAGRTFMPVNEEQAVYTARQLYSGGVDEAAFLCGSSEKDDRFRQLTESTSRWSELKLLCASGVISSGLSCVEQVFSLGINFFANRSDNSWDNEQKWLRQRIAFLSFLFYFRNRGAPSEVVDVSEFEALAKQTLAQLLKSNLVPQLARTLLEDASKVQHDELSRLFLVFSAKAELFIRDDHVNYRRNVIERLNNRAATVRFMAPVAVSKSEKEHIRLVIFEQRKAIRRIQLVVNARPLSNVEFNELTEERESNGTLSVSDQAALERYHLALKYQVSQNNLNASQFKDIITEHYAKKLQDRIKRLKDTIIDSVENAMALDLHQQEHDPLNVRNYRTLAQQMTTTILRVFSIEPDWIRNVSQQLQSYKLKNSDMQGLYDSLNKSISSALYKLLHGKDAIAFPMFGTSSENEKKVYYFFRAFLKTARAIPIVRKEDRPRVGGKRLSIPYLAIDCSTLVERVMGFRPLPSSKQIFVIRSLSFQQPGILSINAGEATVPYSGTYQFALSNNNNGYPAPSRRDAWFLKGRVICFRCKDVAEIRSYLTQQRYTLVDDRAINYVTCVGPPRLQVNWITNEVTDVSDYTEAVVERQVTLYKPEREMKM
jgi:hypothetical protein